MSSTYTPVPTATQAPAAAPDPDNFPLLTLPAAGDGATAASVAQAFKVLGDYVSWMKAPLSKASAWAQRLRPYRSARGHRRFVIDHLGFPSGNITGWDENWDKTAAGTFGAALSWLSTPGSGSVLPGVPSGGAPGGVKFAYVSIGPAMNVLGVPAQSFFLRAAGLSVPHADLAIACQWPMLLTNVGVNHVYSVAGLVPHASSFPDVGSIPWGARFRKDSADTNWFCEVDGQAPVDSTVAPVANVYQRFRIEYMGAGVSDDSTARTIFYIDDTLVANVAHVLTPTNTDRIVPFFGAKGDNSAVGTPSLIVGPVQYRQNMFQTV